MEKKIEDALKNNETALHSLVVFRRASNAIGRQEIQTIKKHNLTVSQFGVMEALYNKGNLRIQDLIDKLLSTSGNMTVVIRNMIRDGYIFKVTDEKDKRSFLIGLTPLGRKTIEKILPEHYENIGQIFSILSTEEQETLSTILKKFKLWNKFVGRLYFVLLFITSHFWLLPPILSSCKNGLPVKPQIKWTVKKLGF